MAEAMGQAAKGEGVGNVFLKRASAPEPVPGEVLSRTGGSLIRRGSELWRRHVMEEQVSAKAIGSTTGRM